VTVEIHVACAKAGTDAQEDKKQRVTKPTIRRITNILVIGRRGCVSAPA
jgi:hypothetical protein